MEQLDFFEHVGESFTGEALKRVQELCRNGFKQKKVVEELRAQLKKEEGRLDGITQDLLPLLKDAGMTEIKVEGCGKVTVDTKISVKMPAEPDARAALFSYLRDKGVYDSLTTIHSATLNAFYNGEIQAAREEGRTDFSVPGLTPSGEWSKLRFK